MLARVTVKIILPFVCSWARKQEALILAKGNRLTDAQIADAKTVGVQEPERVRVCSVKKVPLPLFGVLRRAGEKLRIVPDTIGIALGHGIFLRFDYSLDEELLRHELAHVAQYERLGGLRPFLGCYLLECLTSGYPLGELEEEAAHISKGLTSRGTKVAETARRP
ncbi:MAG: hypothetical protein ABI944_00100 [Chthoniobacterales bacterium]